MLPRNNNPSPARAPRRVRWPRLLAALLLAAAVLAAQEVRRGKQGEYIITTDVDLVVLHTTVVNKNGLLITELPSERFRIYEDGVEQKLALFRNEEVPVTVGLVLDNSSSMADNRRAMLAGALTFAETSNALDEIFVVNFNDDFFLDLGEKDFTSDVEELKEALDKTRTQGNTAFYDAVRASLRHLKRGTRQKRVLLIISDGADHASLSDFDTVLRESQESEASLYLVSPPCQDDRKLCRRAKRHIRKLAELTGGMSYFTTSIEQVESLCRQIASEIRSQYVLGYYPTNRARDGGFRHVEVVVDTPKGFDKLYARHRPGYFAANSGSSAGSQ